MIRGQYKYCNGSGEWGVRKAEETKHDTRTNVETGRVDRLHGTTQPRRSGTYIIRMFIHTAVWAFLQVVGVTSLDFQISS